MHKIFYFWCSSFLGLDPMEKIALMSNVSKKVTDTTRESMEAKYETDSGLSIGTMTFDFG